jgi:hypothetical protein
MKVFVSLDLPYDRYLPQSCVTFHYKRRRPPTTRFRGVGTAARTARARRFLAAQHQSNQQQCSTHRQARGRRAGGRRGRRPARRRRGGGAYCLEKQAAGIKANGKKWCGPDGAGVSAPGCTARLCAAERLPAGARPAAVSQRPRTAAESSGFRRWPPYGEKQEIEDGEWEGCRSCVRSEADAEEVAEAKFS